MHANLLFLKPQFATAEWVIKVTETQKDDGVKFRSFTENQFWRMIDYAMSDDFPTVNTDILCWVDGESCEFSLDLSFNLDIPIAPVSLDYKPLRGEKFTISQTVPLPLQISWKLHQTIVRPRLKDLFDLIHLLQHPSFTKESLEQTLHALAMECNTENIGKERIKSVFSGDLGKIYEGSDIEKEWALWRHENYSSGGAKFSFGFAKHITNSNKLPFTAKEFEGQFKIALQNAGITIETIEEMAIKNNSKIQVENSTETKTENTSWLDSLKKFFG